MMERARRGGRTHTRSSSLFIHTSSELQRAADYKSLSAVKDMDKSRDVYYFKRWSSKKGNDSDVDIHSLSRVVATMLVAEPNSVAKDRAREKFPPPTTKSLCFGAIMPKFDRIGHLYFETGNSGHNHPQSQFVQTLPAAK